MDIKKQSISIREWFDWINVTKKKQYLSIALKEPLGGKESPLRKIMQEEKYVGTVVWFDASLGYGFISRPDEADLFVHWSDIISEGFKTLKKGQEVIFSIGLNNRKQPKAIEVIISEAKGE